MLLDLKKLNIHVGLVTNKPKQETIWTLNHTGLNDIFEIIICPEDVKNCKPNPEGILLAINHFNVNCSIVVISMLYFFSCFMEIFKDWPIYI